jgi:mRNA interferase RelE/StbE
MYSVSFDDGVIIFLSTLPKEVSKRVYDKIISTKENPFHFFERLEGRKDYKLRVGDYRVIADIDQASNIIFVTLVGHRKNVYANV